MVKKGESKTYFPTEMSKDSLKAVAPSKDPKEAEKLKSERTQYITDTRTALGLPTDVSDKNLYDAEVIKAVKESQKKAGIQETGLFDKATAEAVKKQLVEEKAKAPTAGAENTKKSSPP